jgi:hypothetical protein
MTRRLSRAASPDETLHDQFASPKVQIQWISKRPMHELASKYIEVCNSCWYIRSPNPYTKMSWWFRSISGKDTAELVNYDAARGLCQQPLSYTAVNGCHTTSQRSLASTAPAPPPAGSCKYKGALPKLATTRALHWSMWLCG